MIDRSESLADAIARLARLLRDWGRPAAVIGGLAMIARVRPRPTDDIDLIIAVPPSADALLALAVAHGYAYDEEETRAFLEGGLVRLWGPPSRAEGFGLDLLFVDSAFFEQVVDRATSVDVLGTPLQIATLEDLVLLKLEANRPIDIDDILAIKDAADDSLDMSYLRRQAADLELGERLALYFP